MMSIAEMRLIVNPVAAGGAVGKRWPRIQRTLREEGLPFTAALTEGTGHATELARQALAEGYRTIVALGGDGTINEVVNGLVIEGQIDPEVVLGIIPGGAGDDFRRTLGIPADYRQACRRLMGHEARLIDLGEVEYTSEGGPGRRCFINFAGLGFDAAVVERTRRSWKSLPGTIPYLMSLLVTIVTYQNKDMRILLDGEELRQRANAVIVFNGRYCGGGMFIAPDADPSDGLFDIIVIGDTTKLEFLANVPKVYRGTHLTHPKVDAYRAREVRVEARQRMFLQGDGELIGEAPVTFRVVPQALRIRV